MSNLADVLDRLTVEGELYETLPESAVRCYACGHRCLIREGRRGICQVRFNQGGKLLAPWVSFALQPGAWGIASSYNEPLITSEWAVGIFHHAQQAGLKCVYISNGNATPEVLQYLRPYIVGYKVDLKTMQDHHYRQLGGVLEHVLDTIRMAREMGLWVEVVTLTVPGFNDSTDELMDAARFIASVSNDIPGHVTAFHPDYKMTDPPPTSVATLLRAAEIGQEAGLNYVYAGNLPGRGGEDET